MYGSLLEKETRSKRSEIKNGGVNMSQYNELMEQLSEQVKNKDGMIEKLEKKIKQLEEEVSNIHAAANDTESELLINADTWKHQALNYRAENERLTNNLLEVREKLNKSEGENILFRAVIKEVII